MDYFFLLPLSTEESYSRSATAVPQLLTVAVIEKELVYRWDMTGQAAYEDHIFFWFLIV